MSQSTSTMLVKHVKAQRETKASRCACSGHSAVLDGGLGQCVEGRLCCAAL